MATTVPLTGNSSTVSGLGVTSSIISIEPSPVNVDALDISVLATAGYKKSRPSDLRNPVTVKVMFYYLGGQDHTGTTMAPLASVIYTGTTFTVTYPALTGGSVAGTAFVKDYELPAAKNGEVMVGSYTIQYDGATGPAISG